MLLHSQGGVPHVRLASHYGGTTRYLHKSGGAGNNSPVTTTVRFPYPSYDYLLAFRPGYYAFIIMNLIHLHPSIAEVFIDFSVPESNGTRFPLIERRNTTC